MGFVLVLMFPSSTGTVPPWGHWSLDIFPMCCTDESEFTSWISHFVSQQEMQAKCESELPSLVKEGWLRQLRKMPRSLLSGRRRGGWFKHRLLLEVERTTPSALSKERGDLLDARPPLLCQGGESSRSTPCAKVQTVAMRRRRRQ